MVEDPIPTTTTYRDVPSTHSIDSQLTTRVLHDTIPDNHLMSYEPSDHSPNLEPTDLPFL